MEHHVCWPPKKLEELGAARTKHIAVVMDTVIVNQANMSARNAVRVTRRPAWRMCWGREQRVLKKICSKTHMHAYHM